MSASLCAVASWSSVKRPTTAPNSSNRMPASAKNFARILMATRHLPCASDPVSSRGTPGPHDGLRLVLYGFASSEALAPGGDLLLNRGAQDLAQGRGRPATNQTRLHFPRYQKQHSRRLVSIGIQKGPPPSAS